MQDGPDSTYSVLSGIGTQDLLEPPDDMGMDLDQHPYFQAMLRRVYAVICLFIQMFMSLEHE